MDERKEEVLEYLFRKKDEKVSIEDIKRDLNFEDFDEIIKSLIDENKIVLKNGFVYLTEKGSIEGESIKDKHEFIEEFLKNIGVPNDFAHEKACEIEHHIKEDYKKIFPLSSIKEGEEVEIVLINGGRGFVQRLFDLGLTPNTKIKVIRKAPFGPIEISLRGYHLALGRGVINKIWVKKI